MRERIKQALLAFETHPVRAATILVGCALAALLPALAGKFFSDDLVYVVGNERLAELPLSRFWEFFTTRTNQMEFLPLRDLSYRIDTALFGSNPTGYHAHNLLLYALCCLIVWHCALAIAQALKPSLEQSGAQTFAAIVTAIFATHPAHVESAAWIAGRKELLSGLFSIAALWQFALGVRSRGPLKHYVASWLCFCLAVMSKSTVLPIAGVAMLLALSAPAERNSLRLQRLGASLLFLVIAAGWLQVVLNVGSSTGVRLDPFDAHALLQDQPITQAAAILGKLIEITIAPYNLRLIYDVMDLGWMTTFNAIIGGSCLLATLAGVYWAWRRHSVTGLGIALFAATSLPFLQLVPYNTWSLVSERFLFLPVLGFAIIVAQQLLRLTPDRRYQFLFPLLAAYLGITAMQSLKWADPDQLSKDAAYLSPRTSQASKVYIENVLLPEARYTEARELAEKLRHPVKRELLFNTIASHQAMGLDDWQSAWSAGRMVEDAVNARSSAMMQWIAGNLAEKRGEFQLALKLFYWMSQKTQTPNQKRSSGEAIARLRSQQQERLDHLRRQETIEPENLQLRGTLANLEMELYLLEGAERKYLSILQQAPKMVAAIYNLALTYSRQGRHEEAIQRLQEAISLGYDRADVWNKLGMSYQETVQTELAKSAYEKALETEQTHWFAAVNLGRMQLALNALPEARRALQIAKRRAPADKHPVIEMYLEMVQQTEQGY